MTVESDARWTVVAVGGSAGTVDQLVEDLTSRDPASLFSSGPDPAGSSKVTYVPAYPKKKEPTKR